MGKVYILAIGKKANSNGPMIHADFKSSWKEEKNPGLNQPGIDYSKKYKLV